MKQSRWMLLAAATVVIGLGVAIWLTPPRITAETCRMIEKGMHRSDVERLLGPPEVQDAGGARWMGDGVFIVVEFDDNGEVTETLWDSAYRENVIERAYRRWWLGR